MPECKRPIIKGEQRVKTIIEVLEYFYDVSEFEPCHNLFKLIKIAASDSVLPDTKWITPNHTYKDGIITLDKSYKAVMIHYYTDDIPLNKTGVIAEYTPVTYKNKCIGYVNTDTQTDKPVISTNLFAHNLETMMLNDRIASLEIKNNGGINND